MSRAPLLLAISAIGCSGSVAHDAGGGGQTGINHPVVFGQSGRLPSDGASVKIGVNCRIRFGAYVLDKDPGFLRAAWTVDKQPRQPLRNLLSTGEPVLVEFTVDGSRFGTPGTHEVSLVVADGEILADGGMSSNTSVALAKWVVLAEDGACPEP